jgi:hypothetical protein
LASFTDCINACSVIEGYVAVAWAAANSYGDGTVSACGYASGYNTSDAIPEYEMAFLSNGDGSED